MKRVSIFDGDQIHCINFTPEGYNLLFDICIPAVLKDSDIEDIHLVGQDKIDAQKLAEGLIKLKEAMNSTALDEFLIFLKDCEGFYL